jgi:hypothetical protein
MSRGATYIGLLATLKQDEILREVRRPYRTIDALRPRRRHSLTETMRRVLRGKR